MENTSKNQTKTDSKIKDMILVIYALVVTVLAAKYIAVHGVEDGDLLAVMAAIFIVPAAFMLQKWRRETGRSSKN